MGRIVLKNAIADGGVEIDLKGTGRRQWLVERSDGGVPSTRRRDHHLRKDSDDGLSQYSGAWSPLFIR